MNDFVECNGMLWLGNRVLTYQNNRIRNNEQRTVIVCMRCGSKFNNDVVESEM